LLEAQTIAFRPVIPKSTVAPLLSTLFRLRIISRRVRRIVNLPVRRVIEAT
jgi:hypothetical protein